MNVQLHGMRRFVLTGKRTWSLLDEQGQSLGTLMRPRWFSNNAELVVPEGLLMLRPRKILHRSIAAFLGDVPLIEVQFPWRGGLVLVPVNSTGEELRVKRVSWFKEEWRVADAQGVEHARIKYHFSWKHFEYEPALIAESGEPLSAMQLLTLIHALFVFQRRRTAAVS